MPHPSKQLTMMCSGLHVALIGFLMETMLCSALIVIFCAGVWMSLAKSWPNGRSKRDVALFAASAAMFVLAIFHIGLDCRIMVTSGIMRGADLETLSRGLSALNVPNQLGYLKFTIYVLQTLIADGFMLYRVFMVWSSSWCAISFPLFLYTCSSVLGFAIIVLDNISVNPTTLRICQQSYFIATLLTNVIATVLVMRPLLVSRNSVHEYRPKGSHLRTVRWRVMQSILQSAAVFTVSSLCFTVTLFVSPLGFSFCHNVFPPVMAMIFTLTVWRIYLGSGPPMLPLQLPLDINVNGPGYYPYGPGAHARSHSCPSLPITEREPVRPIAIQVSVSTTKTFDGEHEREVRMSMDCKSAKVNVNQDEVTHATPNANACTVILVASETDM